MRTTVMTAMALALVCASASASNGSMAGLIGDAPAREYRHDGTVYIEALRGRDFAIRLTNPTPYRVAVALSVDGLNTIDARHTDAWSAEKWLLDPWESTVISGWQIDQSNARRFFFTGEKSSYGAALRKIENLGVIEAGFYPGRPRRREANVAPRAMPAPPATAGGVGAEAAKPSDDYAATGMGQRDRHEIDTIDVDLD